MALTASPKKAAVPKMTFADGFFQYCNTYTREAADWESGFDWTAANSDARVDIQPASSMSEQLQALLVGENIQVDKVAFFLSTVSTITVGDSMGIAAAGGTAEDTFFTVVGVYDWDSHIEVALKSGRLADPA